MIRMAEEHYWYHKKNYFCKKYNCNVNCPMRDGALCMYPEVIKEVSE